MLYISANRLREVQALASFTDNPYIVRYFAVWVEQRRLFVQTEFCSGGSLLNRVHENKPFQEIELLQIIRQVSLVWAISCINIF